MRRIGDGWIVLAAAILAAVIARPYAGAWNDGSRLATVESLVDRHTFSIDDSIYLTPASAVRPPYDSANAMVARYGTLDKLLIDGHWYSDKSPVPAVLMAGPYQLWRWAGGTPAAERPDLFALGLTWLFAGVPYVFGVWAVGRTTRSVGVPAPWDLALTAGFAFASLALPYAEHVNNHILLLAVATGFGEAAVRPGPITSGRAAWMGLLAGFGYSIDLGAGPPLAVAVAGLVAWQANSPGRWRWLAAFACAAAPFVLANHIVTYAIAETIGPANANPAYLDWPGSPFTGPNMTGRWQHASVARAGLYALDLLYGKKGFLFHSPPLLLAAAVLPLLVWRRVRERPVLIALSAWALSTWLLYAATSRNLAGVSLSIRWFVPLLATGYLVLAVLIREVPAARTDLALLSVGGLVLTVEGTIRGPWSSHLLYAYWPVIGLMLLAWGVIWARRGWRWMKRRRQGQPLTTAGKESREPFRAAPTG
jgi:hypothetical protein